MNIIIFLDTLKEIQARIELLTEEVEKRRQELASTGTEIGRLWTLLRVSTEGMKLFDFFLIKLLTTSSTL